LEPKNTEVIMHGEPVLVSGGGTIKALSAEFLFDLQQHWRKSREQVLDDVAKKYPAQYFAGMVTLAKVIRWEIGDPGALDRPRSPEEVVERLEQRIGPEGRKLFERFLREVQQLEERQQLTASPSGPTASGEDAAALAHPPHQGPGRDGGERGVRPAAHSGRDHGQARGACGA
jgi:hypothetical protein